MLIDKIKMDDVPYVMASLVKEIHVLRTMVENLVSSERAVNKVAREPRKILNTSDLCFLLGKTPVTIYRMVKRGELKAYKKGKELYFFQDEVIDSIEESNVNIDCNQ